jgi:hypothetical protein
MKQIRESDFLQQNPATGPSLFDVAALQASEADADADLKLSAGRDEGDAERAAGGEEVESVEDLARTLVLQVFPILQLPAPSA